MASTHRIARWLFLRALSVSLGGGFLALLQQAPGLIGSRGITPLADLLAGWTRTHGAAAPWRAPSLFWLSAADAAVVAVPAAGLAASALLLCGLVPRLACIVAYVCWLSFRAIDGGPVCWFNYPFDDLQTEAVFLGIFVAPGVWGPWQRAPDLPRWVRWLCIWFLFRAMFGPGITKVLFQDSWRDLSAVADFLLTMPHPTPLAAVLLDQPAWLLQSLAALTLLCELVCPFLFFWPGRPRRVAACLGIVLMLGIQAVCNIRGFNIVTAGLLLLLWDDASLRALLPGARRGALAVAAVAVPAADAARGGRWRRLAAGTVVALSVGASIEPNAALLGFHPAAATSVTAALERAIRPFGIAAAYTMFCIVPKERSVLVVQGSDDAERWRDLQPLGPSACVDRAPRFFAPYHDYLGFKLWFAGYCPPEQDGWLHTLQQRLLDKVPEVVHLFEAVPAGEELRHVRVAWFRYRHATAAERAAGVHWQRDFLGVRLPSRSRRD